ncbi:hypothetical protein BHM03_00060176 [Ensete ventricosum]|nr:hypothetical protein BHM03_00060176 [Ensete ventricosum]
MKRYDPTLSISRVLVVDICPRKALCLCSLFSLLCQLPSSDLGTSLCPTQIVLYLDLH